MGGVCAGDPWIPLPRPWPPGSARNVLRERGALRFVGGENRHKERYLVFELAPDEPQTLFSV